MLHPEADVATLLLESRTAAPDFDPGFVRRTRLIDDLRDSGSRLVTVIAPAGYGKTSLLAEWRQNESRATGWLSLRAGDEDPSEVIRLIARACAAFGAANASVFEQIAVADGEALARMAPALAVALSRCDVPFVLFIDDFHVLERADSVDALGVALAAVPQGSQVVLAGRRRPTPFARDRLLSNNAHVAADDLRIDLEGAARIAEDAGADVDATTLTDWVDRCGGWAAGLHMCALLAKQNRFSSVGDADLLADYLYQECIAELPESTRRFLLDTSVLQTLIPDLCNAVADRSDSAHVLRDLEVRQLFVTADRARHSYRMHPLFHEYLSNELQLESPTAVRGLHLRAAQWFHEHGQLSEAIDHAIAAEDFAMATALVTAVALGAYEAGQGARLGRWLEQIGDARVLANPTAVVIIAWFAVLAAGDDAADKWSTLLGTLPDDTPAEGVNIASAKALIGAIMMRRGMDRALADAEYGSSLEGVDSPWRDPALQVFGSTLLHAGYSELAVEILTQAKHVADARGNPATVAICETEFALLAIEAEDWAGAERHSLAALDVIRDSAIDGYVMAPYAHSAAACVGLAAGRRSEGLHHLTWAMSERRRCGRAVPLLGIPTRLLLARANLMVGDGSAARLLLAEIDEMTPPAGGRVALDHRIDAMREALRLFEARSGTTNESIALTAAEQRLLPYLQTHLTRAEIALRLFVSPNTVGTQMSSIFRKFGARTRTEAVSRAFELELLGSVPDILAE